MHGSIRPIYGNKLYGVVIVIEASPPLSVDDHRLSCSSLFSVAVCRPRFLFLYTLRPSSSIFLSRTCRVSSPFSLSPLVQLTIPLARLTTVFLSASLF